MVAAGRGPRTRGIQKQQENLARRDDSFAGRTDAGRRGTVPGARFTGWKADYEEVVRSTRLQVVLPESATTPPPPPEGAQRVQPAAPRATSNSGSRPPFTRAPHQLSRSGPQGPPFLTPYTPATKHEGPPPPGACGTLLSAAREEATLAERDYRPDPFSGMNGFRTLSGVGMGGDEDEGSNTPATTAVEALKELFTPI